MQSNIDIVPRIFEIYIPRRLCTHSTPQIRKIVSVELQRNSITIPSIAIKFQTKVFTVKVSREDTDEGANDELIRPCPPPSLQPLNRLKSTFKLVRIFTENNSFASSLFHAGATAGSSNGRTVEIEMEKFSGSRAAENGIVVCLVGKREENEVTK